MSRIQIEKEIEEGKHLEFINWNEIYKWLFKKELGNKEGQKYLKEELSEVMEKNRVTEDRAKIILVTYHKRVLPLNGGRFVYLDESK